MISRRTETFRQLLAALPVDVRRAALSSYLFRDNPQHNSLEFKLINARSRVYSARISREYRVLGTLRGDTVTWFWIEPHSEYDQPLKRL